jgi:tetratricopeptide (TPR) repeat protein
MARIDSLPEGSKSLLQAMSVAGREVSHDLIKKVTGFSEQDLLSHLSVLKDSELLYERGIYPQATYIFKHTLTQEVAYNSLLLKRRKEIHEEIGKTIEVLCMDRLEEYYELLAYHYGHSANTKKAIEYLDLANQKAIRVNAMEEAKAYFDEAMGRLDALPDSDVNRKRRISLLVNQGDAFFLLIKMPEYYDLLARFQTIAQGLGDPELLGAFYARLGHCHFAFGQYDQAIQTLTKAAELCETTGNAKDAGIAYTFLKWTHSDIGNFDRVLALKENFLRAMEQGFNLRWYVSGLCATSRACSYLGRWDEAVEAAEKALRIAEKFSDNSTISVAAYNLSINYSWKGDLSRAVEYGELAVRKAPTPGDKARSQRSLGWALCRAGELNRGIENLTGALTVFLAGRFMPSLIPLMCYLGEGYWLAGEDDKAKQTLEEGLGMAERCGTRYYLGFANRLLGEIALKNNPAQARFHFEKSMALLQEIKAENELAVAYVGYARLYKQEGKVRQRRKYLTKALEIFERLGTLIQPDKVRKELAEID